MLYHCRSPNTGCLCDIAIDNLAPDERRRAATTPMSVKGVRFAVARDCLRRILADFLDMRPQEIVIPSSYGKPFNLTRSKPPVFFNISYEELWCVIVLCKVQIGVDIQILEGRRLEAFQQLFHEHLKHRDCFSQPNLPEAYIWARMEAFGKMTGQGLGVGLKRLFEIATGLIDPPTACRFYDFRFIDGIVGAVCVEGSQIRSIHRRKLIPQMARQISDE